jgi:hypothetical protein
MAGPDWREVAGQNAMQLSEVGCQKREMQGLNLVTAVQPQRRAEIATIETKSGPDAREEGRTPCSGRQRDAFR